MVKVSLCMIVRNEEKVLERCLKSVADIVDEIIIVDTGSIDRTKEIAADYTDKIYDFLWCDDFSAARNFAFSKGTGEYFLWMDAVMRTMERCSRDAVLCKFKVYNQAAENRETRSLRSG